METPVRAHVVCVPLSTRLGRRQRFAAAREAAREALRASVELAGAPRALPCEDWPRLASGALAPAGGWHASFADTTGLAVAVVAPVPVGIDAEWLQRPRWAAARERFRSEGELARLGGEARADVLALWSAKEALLKLAGVGIADLGRCPLVARAGERFELEHAGRRHTVQVRVVLVGGAGTHVVACASAVPVELALSELQESA
jgi:4'-phosphopantetheinyl transferase superfamily protein